MKKVFLGFVFLMGIQQLFAQLITPEEYIATYKDIAIREMKRMGVPAAIKLAQGILETENGNSALVKKSNNHFGIKCKDTWTGGGVSHDDDAPGECFRVYKTAEESYRDHSNFLRSREWYAFLFKLDPLDYKGWAYGLKKAGYATNKKYPEILIKYIEKYNLQQYSKEGAVDMPDFQTEKYESDPESLDKFISKNNQNVVEIKSTSDSSVSEINKTPEIKYYLVQPKEGLYSIAKKYGIKVQQLKEWNNLTTDSVKIGQQLIISR